MPLFSSSDHMSPAFKGEREALTERRVNTDRSQGKATLESQVLESCSIIYVCLFRGNHVRACWLSNHTGSLHSEQRILCSQQQDSKETESDKITLRSVLPAGAGADAIP